GLDPVGRKEIRDLILKERDHGRTIFFSTHILSDVEMMCDHVTILRKGSVVVTGEMSALLRKDVKRTDVTVEGESADFERFCTEKGYRCRRSGARLSVEVTGQEELAGVIRQAVSSGLTLVEVVPRTESLEDLFLREAISEQSS